MFILYGKLCGFELPLCTIDRELITQLGAFGLSII